MSFNTLMLTVICFIAFNDNITVTSYVVVPLASISSFHRATWLNAYIPPLRRRFISQLSASSDTNSGSSSSSSTSSGKTINMTDEEFEQLLMGGDNAKPSYQSIETNIGEDESKSDVNKYFTEAITLLAKCSKRRLRELINKHNIDNKIEVPDEADDVESHVNAALAITWEVKNGDWIGYLKFLQDEIGNDVKDMNVWITKTVLEGNKLSESRIISLIIYYGDQSLVPKFDKKKYEGKFLKGDYLAALIDILREKCGNEYDKVYSMLLQEVSKGNNEVKKGFAKK